MNASPVGGETNLTCHPDRVRATLSEAEGSKGGWKGPDILSSAMPHQGVLTTRDLGPQAPSPAYLNIVPHDVFKAPKKPLPRDMPSRAAAHRKRPVVSIRSSAQARELLRCSKGQPNHLASGPSFALLGCLRRVGFDTLSFTFTFSNTKYVGFA